MIEESMRLSFGGREVQPQVRMLSDMRDVLYDADYLRGAADQELYYMYRDLYLSKRDHEVLREHNLRFDITIIPSRMLGREFVKTAGHYHPNAQGSKFSYPELYEILKGEAHFLFQKLGKGDEVMDAVVIKGNQGDKVLIPPGYGHVTINPSNKVLKMANFVARGFESLYEPYRRMKGAVYYELESGFVANNAYDKVPELRVLKQKGLSKLGLKHGKEMYGLIRSDPNSLDFLNMPQNYIDMFKDSIS